MQSPKLQSVGDTVFSTFFSVLDEEDAEIVTAYLAATAQGPNHNMLAGDWVKSLPHSTLKPEYETVSVGTLFAKYMDVRYRNSEVRELVLQRTARRVH